MTASGIEVGTKIFQSLQPFAFLGALRLEELIPRCRFERIPAGLTLFREGESDHQAIYLLQGEVLLSGATSGASCLLAEPASKKSAPALHYPIADKQPRQVSAVAVTDVEIARIDSELLDFATAWDELSGYYDAARTSSSGAAAGGDGNWMSRVRQSLAFRQIPLSNLEALGAALEPVAVRAGQVVTREGESAADYYLIESGSATMTRETSGTGPANVSTLEGGAGFGEESLQISEERNRATVTMQTRGTLWRLKRQHLLALRHEPPRSLVPASAANAMVASGAATWVDIRRPEESANSRLPNSRLLPLRQLHSLAGNLRRETEYICYCNCGRRSAVAADLLARRGLRTHVLEGGLRAMPECGFAAMPE